MNRKAALLAGVALAGLFGASAGASGQEIGDVTQERYAGARGTPPGQDPRNLYYRNDVYAEELVETGNGGSTALRFADDTHIRLGSNASLVLDRYVYDPDTGSGEAVVTLTKGLMRFITGDMHKDGYSIRTPTATMTVRGTDFLVWRVPTTGATILSVLSGEVHIVGCGNHEFTAAADESVRINGDCSGGEHLAGRAVPHDSGIDNGGGDGRGGTTNRPNAGPPAKEKDDGGDDGGDGPGDGY